MSLAGSSKVSELRTPIVETNIGLIIADQMTIMIESSRSFLFTEYARTGCGTFKNQGTDPKVWDALPVCCHRCRSNLMHI
jgi:homogentisate 1,2-dioxygenase